MADPGGFGASAGWPAGAGWLGVGDAGWLAVGFGACSGGVGPLLPLLVGVAAGSPGWSVEGAGGVGPLPVGAAGVSLAWSFVVAGASVSGRDSAWDAPGSVGAPASAPGGAGLPSFPSTTAYPATRSRGRSNHPA